VTTVEQAPVGAAGFLAALAATGLQVDQQIAQGVEFAVFPYQIEVGDRVGEVVTVALAIQGDWPMSPPPGPHISPQLGHPGGAVHPSPLGPGWEYWSRPAPNWATDRSGRAYLRHLRTLFSQL
jgi:hypothetical protein